MAREHQGWGVIRCPPLCAVLLVAALLRAQPVVAAGVVGTGRPASCTEAALDAALVGGGLVTFVCGPDPVTITITRTKTIDADTALDGESLITISGPNSVGLFGGVFSVSPGVNFTIQSLTIADGLAYSGGGIENVDGTVTVISSTFSRNYSAGHAGGAIYNFGTLTVTNSTFSGNGAFSGGGIVNSGTLTVTNSTVSGNRAASGGGIVNSGTLTVTNSTVSGNSADYNGGGIVNGGTLTVTNSTFSGNSTYGVPGGSTGAINGPATLRNTIVANNTGGNCDGVITDGGHNLDDGTSCGFSMANGSLSNTDPKLDPGLANNGGPTQTIALQAGSPAIDAGDPEVCANPPVNGIDQRGYIRPGIGHTDCSIGAYEADAVSVAACVGDCDGNGVVAINELILGVNIVLAIRPDTACPAFANSQGMVDIAQLITGVNNTLDGCEGG